MAGPTEELARLEEKIAKVERDLAAVTRATREAPRARTMLAEAERYITAAKSAHDLGKLGDVERKLAQATDRLVRAQREGQAAAAKAAAPVAGRSTGPEVPKGKGIILPPNIARQRLRAEADRLERAAQEALAQGEYGKFRDLTLAAEKTREIATIKDPWLRKLWTDALSKMQRHPFVATAALFVIGWSLYSGSYVAMLLGFMPEEDQQTAAGNAFGVMGQKTLDDMANARAGGATDDQFAEWLVLVEGNPQATPEQRALYGVIPRLEDSVSFARSMLSFPLMRISLAYPVYLHYVNSTQLRVTTLRWQVEHVKTMRAASKANIPVGDAYYAMKANVDNVDRTWDSLINLSGVVKGLVERGETAQARTALAEYETIRDRAVALMGDAQIAADIASLRQTAGFDSNRDSADAFIRGYDAILSKQESGEGVTQGTGKARTQYKR